MKIATLITLILLFPTEALAFGGSEFVQGPIAGLVIGAVLVVTIGGAIIEGFSSNPVKTVRILVAIPLSVIFGFGFTIFLKVHAGLDNGLLEIGSWILGWIGAYYIFCFVGGVKE